MFIRTVLTTIVVVILLSLISWRLTLILIGSVLPIVGVVMGIGGLLKKLANQI